MIRRRRRSAATAFRPMPRPLAPLGRRSLAASVSALSLMVTGLAFAPRAQAQDAPPATLPGTEVLQGGRWSGAKMPTVAQGNGGMVMTIKQEKERALLDWAKFNVAANEEVIFDQQDASWIALNRIFDARPSEIAGKITAKGQVWLQNTNGIVFKNGAKVNAHTILATALPITEAQLNSGLLAGNGVIRNSRLNQLFYDFSNWNHSYAPKPIDGLNPLVLIGPSQAPVGGQTLRLTQLMALAAIRQAVLASRNYEGADNTFAQSWAFDQLTYSGGFMIDPRFTSNGLIEVLEQIVKEIDLGELGDYNYDNYTFNDILRNPALQQSIPQALRDAVEAKIKTRFVDNYSNVVAAAKQRYDNYLVNSRVVVETGASLTAKSDNAAMPGKIMLFGPNVSNAGRLEAHDGQVLMAAGEVIKLSAQQGFMNSVRGGLSAFVMANSIVDDHGSYPGMSCCQPSTYAAWDANYRERADAVGMTVTNSGTILSDRGNVSMIGGNVGQNGSILVTNGVRQRNGSIILQASHGFSNSGGHLYAGGLTLGKNSLTSIIPDQLDITGLAADTFAKGVVRLGGKDILLDNGATIVSRSGEVSIHASRSGALARGASSPVAFDGAPVEGRGEEGSFTMLSGAKIDVSGLKNVERSVADNVFEVEVRSNEVSGAPAQRDGILIGEKVYVDRRTGATIVDWTGALAGEQRTAEQLSTDGGSVTIRASEFAVIDDGATIDLSGGSTKYTDAEIKVTRLRDAYGRFHNISDANPNLRYTGIDQSTRLEKGYVDGGDAGAVEILSPSSRLFGKLKGDITIGERQLMAAIGKLKAPRLPTGAVGAQYVTTPSLPSAASATLHRGGSEYGTWSSNYLFITADESKFTGKLWTETAGGGSPFASREQLLDPALTGQDWAEYEGEQPQFTAFVEDDFFAGMGDVSFGFGSSHQTQTVNAGAIIRLASGGSFSMGGENGVGTVLDNVQILAPSGEVSLGAGEGMTIGKNVLISVAAPWINDADAPGDMLRGYVDAGEINIGGAKLTGPITLDAGGGGWYRRLSPPTETGPGTFELIEGEGGSIALGGGGVTIGEVLGLADINLAGLAGGGTLSLLASGDLVIGPRGGSTSDEDAEYVDDSLFAEMGARTLSLNANSLHIVSGANVLFQSRNMRIRGRPIDVATGANLRGASDLVLLPAHQRSGGTLMLNADELKIDAGAVLAADTLGTLSLQADTIRLDGTLRAHGGTIGITADDLTLANGSLIDATGIAQTVRVPGGDDGRGFWYEGRIVAGGTVSVDAGNLLFDSGATIDLSGSKGVLTVSRPGRFAAIRAHQEIGSDAGSISLNAAGGYLLGNLRGEAGSIYNYAGKLTLSGGRDGTLIMPGFTDWSTGQVGIESVLQNLMWAFFPEPTPENPVSLREQFATNYGWAIGMLGFGPEDIEDVQITSVAEFTEFMRAALSPITAQSPEDTRGAFVFDPTLTQAPDMPPSTGGNGPFAVPAGYTPGDMAAFERAMTFVASGMLGQQNLGQYQRGASATAGANILRDMQAFDTVNIGGVIESQHDVSVSSKRVLSIAGSLTGAGDMTFRSRNIYLSGLGLTNGSAAPAGEGTLRISGDTVEFQSKFIVGGFGKTIIEAQGDMRGGYTSTGQPIPENNQFTPGIYTTGDLVLRAAQIYPTTDGVLRIESPRSIRIEQTGRRDAPLSAGGLLIVTAPTIEQAGTLRAPFGEIRLTANGYTVTNEDGSQTYVPGTVDLLPGSTTSTAADGRTILYGMTFDGQSWYSPLNETMGELTTPPEKRVALTGDAIRVHDEERDANGKLLPAAIIDVSGSGDVLGLEFVAGPMGQTNVLDEPGVYAIVPAFGDRVIAPIDPLFNGGASKDGGYLPLGSAVWLEAFDDNAAGWYTLLPAEYALTPGGYRLTLAETDPVSGGVRQLGDKSFAVTGRRGLSGTDIQDQTLSTFRLERGTDVRLRSEFFETYGNSFFSSERFLQGLLRSGNPFNANPRLPVDGGFLTLAANRSLELDGEIRAGGASGVTGARGGIVDITSDNIVIAAPGTNVSDLAGYLVLDPGKLSNIAESLLIGGIRRQGAAGLEIVVGQSSRNSPDEVRSAEKSIGAENVVVRTSAANPLTGTELLFAANQQVLVESGSVIRAVGNGADAVDMSIVPSMPAIPGIGAPAADHGGAFLRVSNLGDISVTRSNVQAVSGDMIVEAGAVLEATDSILLDSTRDTLVGNGATLKAGALTAAAGLVSLGEVPQDAGGLVFAGETLKALTQAQKLTLKTYSTFDFYGDVTLNLTGAATFDGAAFVDKGANPGKVAITAGTLELRNSSGGAFDATGARGTLALEAQNIVFGEGDIDFNYAATTVTAAQRVIFDDLGTNNFDGTLRMTAAEFTGSSGAGHDVVAAGALTLAHNGSTAALPVFATAGALLDFTATTVDISAVLRAGSGTIRATATEGDVHLAGGALIDVKGADVAFFDVQGFLPGGGVQLTSNLKDVRVDQGATINISGGAAGGDAGTLVLSAGRGIAVLNGTLQAAVTDGYRGGGFGLTTSTLADFGALNAQLNASGFSRSRDFAILDGDVTLNGVTRVDALRIVTGRGDITVATDARIGSDSAKGGSILLASGGDLIIADGAQLDVNAKGANQRGGSVDLQVAIGGTIDVGAAAISVAGTGSGAGGQVRLRTPQTGDDVGVARWGANVTGGGVQLEAFRVYDLDDADGNAANGHLAEITTALQQQVIGDATAFMDANAGNIRARLGQTGNADFAIVPGIELRSEGDLDLVNNWNLSTARFGGQAGILTLRAGGDLLLNANLSDGFTSALVTHDHVTPPNGWSPGQPLPPQPVGNYTNDQSWSYNLIGGADFAQTNVLSTRAGSDGEIYVGGLIRTGTGDIQVASSGDLNYELPSFVEYRFGTSTTRGARAGTKITIPAGTVITDGTVMRPTTHNYTAGGVPSTFTLYPRLPAGTVLRKGTSVPAGTVLNGTTLAADTVLDADVTLAGDTVFMGVLTIAGKTRTGSEMIWEMPRANNVPLASLPGMVVGAPVIVNGQEMFRGTGDALQRVKFSIPGLGDVEVNNHVNGFNTRSLMMADGREFEDTAQFNLEPDFRRIEQLTGAIYTVGREAAPVANFTPPTLVGYANNNFNGQFIHAAYLEKGGDVSINVAGDINGAGTVIENVRWLAGAGGTAVSNIYGPGYAGKDPEAAFTGGQTSISLLPEQFVNGVGTFGGGDVSITSGGNVDNLVVVLPTSTRVSGGLFVGDPKIVHVTGGGDLVMNVGQNLMGGLLQVGRGTARVDVAGSVIATAQTTQINQNHFNPQHLTLLMDDVQLSLQAGGDIDFRGISPTLGVAGRPFFFGYTERSSAQITSLGGDINYLGTYGENEWLPATTSFIATAGSVTFGAAPPADNPQAPTFMRPTYIDPWSHASLQILAQENVNFWGGSLTIPLVDPTWIPRAINAGGDNPAAAFNSAMGQDGIDLMFTFAQAGPGYGIYGPNTYSGSDAFSRIYAAQGDILGRVSGQGWSPDGYNAGNFFFGHETWLKAGSNIRMGAMTFVTHDTTDIPTIEAGGSIYLPNSVLYGPGKLWVQAGDEIWMGNSAGNGMRAREAKAIYAHLDHPLRNGGSITVLAGIDQSPHYDEFFDFYLNPENVAQAPTWLREYFVPDERGLMLATPVVLKDGSTRVTVYAIELVNYMRHLSGEALIPTEAPDEVSGSRPITRGKLAAAIDPAEYAAALEAFNALEPALKKPLAVKILNAELKTAGREAVGRSVETDGRFTRQGNPTRGYDAIGRLFPGAQRKPGEALAEGEYKWSGNIEMMVSQIRGEAGGDVELVVPGGSVQLASLSVANTNPGTAGIVTQRGGGISAITYGDYIVNQSRTMTADDGDILIWSSYGNIDAGRGRKSSLSVPPVSFPVDLYGTTRIRLSGLPNGAGIATLDQVDGRQGGDVDLYAFNGIVNAGDAGIRASRDLFIGAIEIRGLDNITVGGETNVDLGNDEGQVGALNLENFAQAMEDDAIEQAFDMSKEVEKLRTVRQTILTGSVVSFGIEGENDEEEDEGAQPR